VLAIAKGGLQRRGLNEAPFLRNLEAIADSGKAASDLLLEAYDTRWGKSVDPAFDEYIF
jgi:glutamate--cysteine ligase